MFLDPESLLWFLISFPLEDRNTLQIASQEHANKHKIHQHLNMESGRGTDFPTIAVVNWSTIHLNGFITLQNNAKQGEVVGGCGCQTRSSDYEHRRITKGLDEWKFNVVTVQPSITGRLGLQIFTRPRPPASNPFSRPRLGSGTLHLCSNGGLQNSAANHDGHCLTWVKFWRDEIRLILSCETIDFEIPMVSQKCRVPIAMRDLKTIRKNTPNGAWTSVHVKASAELKPPNWKTYLIISYHTLSRVSSIFRHVMQAVQHKMPQHEKQKNAQEDEHNKNARSSQNFLAPLGNPDPLSRRSVNSLKHFGRNSKLKHYILL